MPEQRPHAAVDNHDANEDGDKNDDEEQDGYLVRSVVHDEFARTSYKNEIRKGGKKRKCVAWKSFCKHNDVM